MTDDTIVTWVNETLRQAGKDTITSFKVAACPTHQLTPSPLLRRQLCESPAHFRTSPSAAACQFWT